MNLVNARRMTRRIGRVPRNDSDYFQFNGGLNQQDSPLDVLPGQCASALNYEMGIAGGYKRIGGYEVFDGAAGDTVYNLLGYAATERPINASGDVITGDTSSANALYLTKTEDGGFGTNDLLNNTAFENASWARTQLTAIDGDVSWVGGETPYLSKITESGITTSHFIQAATGPMNLAVGDYVYLSVFAKYTDGQREGLRMGVVAPMGTFPPAVLSANAIFNIKDQTVQETTNLLDYGIEVMTDGVLRLWILTVAAKGAYSIANIQMMMYGLSGGTLIANYVVDGRHLHLSGPTGVLLPAFGPHSLTHSLIFNSTSNYALSNVTVADAAIPWTTGTVVYDTFSEVTDSVDGSATTHKLTTAASQKIDIRAGDKLYVECYLEYGFASGTNIRGVVFDLGGADGTTWGGTAVSIGFDVGSGDTVQESAALETYSIEQFDTDIWKCSFTTVEALADLTVDLNIKTGIEGLSGLNTLYTGTGKTIGITGLRVQSFPTGGETIKMGHIQTGASAKAVRSGNIVMGAVTAGPFQDFEDLSANAAVFSKSVGSNSENSESDSALDALYSALATNTSSVALEPTGSGAIRGVWEYNGTTYCFRDNVGATACVMFRSSGSGWIEVSFNNVVNFDAGDGTEPNEGDTITVTSGSKSAEILRKVLTGGTWGVDAVGYFVVGAITNGPIANNDVMLVSAVRIADANGASAVPTLLPGGRYEFRNDNFYGSANTFRMYGVDGVNKGFEYDSTGIFTQITTGMTDDTPDHLAVHNGHLFYSFKGGSVQLSGDGDPVSWTVITGASEIGIGDQCTGFNEEVGNSLFIMARNKTFVLQGTTRANFQLDDFNVNSGAHEWSLQRIGLGCYFDDRGFTTIDQAQRVGSTNFIENTVSEMVQPLVADLAKNTSVRTSHLIMTENIYRCYFADGRIVSIGFNNNKVTGHMPLQYPFVANCSVSGEDANGAEVIYVGADDGKVYKLESGTTFDGEDIRAFFRTVLYHSNSPGRFKKYMQARLDAQLSGALTLKGRIEYDFDTAGFNLGEDLDFSTDEAGGYWDDFMWDEFVWDQPTSGIPQVKLEGEGVNCAAYLYSTSSIDKSHTIRGVTLQWQPRRSDRRN